MNTDLTLTPCYIAKCEKWFAHGKTLHEAQNDASQKALKNLSTEERIDKFVEAHSDGTHKYPASDLFVWHGTLTGSCKFGRESFCKDHNIDVDKDIFTIQEFIDLTKNAYGKDVIKLLAEKYK